LQIMRDSLRITFFKIGRNQFLEKYPGAGERVSPSEPRKP